MNLLFQRNRLKSPLSLTCTQPACLFDLICGEVVVKSFNEVTEADVDDADMADPTLVPDGPPPLVGKVLEAVTVDEVVPSEVDDPLALSLLNCAIGGGGALLWCFKSDV